MIKMIAEMFQTIFNADKTSTEIKRNGQSRY